MKTLLAVAAASAALLISSARADTAAARPKWHFPVHVSYVSGVSDVMDAMIGDGYADEKFEWPIGVSFQPYVMFPNGFGIGLDVGPIVVVGVDLDGDEDDWDDDELNTILPLGLYVRYDFKREAATSPYVRAGVRQCLAGGDFLDNGSPGLNVGLGFEFMRDRRVGYGVEIGYDSSEVDVWQLWRGGYRSERPFGFMASAYVTF